MIIDWFRGIGEKKDLDANKYNGVWNRLVSWWNEHDQGARAWTNLLATNATITNLIIPSGGTISGISGRVLQIVSATTSTPTSTTSATFQATNTTASIIPKSSSSAILSFVHGNLYDSDTLNGNFSIATIFRDSTNLGDSSKGLAMNQLAIAAGSGDVPCSMVAPDAPGDTSSHTYTVKIRSDAGGNTTRWQNNSNKSWMILMEISQ